MPVFSTELPSLPTTDYLPTTRQAFRTTGQVFMKASRIEQPVSLMTTPSPKLRSTKRKGETNEDDVCRTSTRTLKMISKCMTRSCSSSKMKNSRRKMKKTSIDWMTC